MSAFFSLDMANISRGRGSTWITLVKNVQDRIVVGEDPGQGKLHLHPEKRRQDHHLQSSEQNDYVG
jgi:hypothetical protein